MEYSITNSIGQPNTWVKDTTTGEMTSNPSEAWFTTDQQEAQDKAAILGVTYLAGPRPKRPH